jgi:hypothetical protein
MQWSGLLMSKITKGSCHTGTATTDTTGTQMPEGQNRPQGAHAAMPPDTRTACLPCQRPSGCLSMQEPASSEVKPAWQHASPFWPIDDPYL